MKYLVYVPGYNSNSGGVTVLHKLAEVLANINEETYISSIVTLPNSKAKSITLEQSYILASHDDCVVIYSETIWNNLLNAKNVVRWLLYIPGFSNGPYEYDTFEHVFLYHKDYGIGTKYADCPILNIFEPKTDIFYDKQLERNGDCFIMRKGSKKNTNKLDGFYIDDLINGDNTDDILMDIFNNHERFISYDIHTYYSIIAAMCGCTSIVIKDNDLSSDDYYKNEFVRYGISYGFEDEEHSKHSKILVKDHMNYLYSKSMQTIYSFHQYCLDNFSK